jgi:4-hydroxybenzoyl-CoA reductase subunit alpha
MNDYGVINKRAPRLDAPDKASGRAKYIDDMTLPGMLYGALLQSPVAHARIKTIDASKARRLPGVKAVLTAGDISLVNYGVSPARYDETVFCHEKVRYVGDEVAAVAAVDIETAIEAVSLIKVDYEELPAVFTLEEALAEGAPLVQERYPGNLCAEVHQEFGNVEEGLRQSDIVRTDVFLNKRQDGAFLEPQGCIADFNANGFLTL